MLIIWKPWLILIYSNADKLAILIPFLKIVNCLFILIWLYLLLFVGCVTGMFVMPHGNCEVLTSPIAVKMMVRFLSCHGNLVEFIDDVFCWGESIYINSGQTVKSASCPVLPCLIFFFTGPITDRWPCSKDSPLGKWYTTVRFLFTFSDCRLLIKWLSVIWPLKWCKQLNDKPVFSCWDKERTLPFWAGHVIIGCQLLIPF